MLSAELREALSEGRWFNAMRQLRACEVSAKDRLLTEIILASRFRHVSRILELVDPATIERLWPDAGACREAVLGLFWTAGPKAARPCLLCLERKLSGAGRPTAEIENLLLVTELSEGAQGCVGESATLDWSEAALPAVYASVNGGVEEPFLLDTGAATSLLSRTFAERMQIEIFDGEPEPDAPAHRNRLAMSACRLNEFRLSGIALTGEVFRVATMPPQLAVAGLLCPFDTLRGFWWQLDFVGRRLIVDATRSEGLSNSMWQTLPLYWDKGNVFTCATVDERYRGCFLLDTGAGGNVLTREFAMRHSLGVGGSVPTVDIRGATKIASAGRHRIRIGNASEVGESEFYLADYGVDHRDIAPLSCAGFLGLPAFAGRQLVVAPNGTGGYLSG